MDMKEAFLIFLQEAQEHLQNMENSLLIAGESKLVGEWVNEVFRALHTLKGSGSMFGLTNIQKLSHQAESVFEEIRNGKLEINEALVNLGLRVKDELGYQLVHCSPRGIDVSTIKDRGLGAYESKGGDPENLDALIMALDSLLPLHKKSLGYRKASGNVAGQALQAGGESGPDRADESPSPASASQTTPVPEKSSQDDEHVHVWQIRFRPETDLLRNGTSPFTIIQELSALGHLDLKADLSAVPVLENLDPQDFHIRWTFTLVTEAEENQLRDIFIFVDSGSNLEMELIRKGPVRNAEESRVASAPGSPALPEASPGMDNLGRPLPGTPAGQEASRSSAYIRVHSQKLQELLDTVGELTVFQEKFRSMSRSSGSADSAASAMGELEALTRRLGNLAIEMNMVGIGSIFTGYQRMVRDLCHSLGKKVRLELAGTETELDKSVAEGLKDPLLHLIRNALDHGLETPEERLARGKSETGILRIKAAHSGGSVMIEIQDDGRGMDFEAIQRKAVERGLMAADQKPDREELLGMIFLPGFSTARAVSDVSGRGVGMDVVKSSIEALRGSIRLETEPGRGTSIKLVIPLTLALVDVLITQSGDQHFAFILEDIAEIVDIAACPMIQRDSAKGQYVHSWRGEPLSCLDLAHFYGTGSPGQGDMANEKACIVIVTQGERHLGLIVHSVVETSQGMIKPMEHMLRKAPGISGSLLFGEGHVAWVMNTVWFLARQMRKEY